MPRKDPAPPRTRCETCRRHGEPTWPCRGCGQRFCEHYGLLRLRPDHPGVRPEHQGTCICGPCKRKNLDLYQESASAPVAPGFSRYLIAEAAGAMGWRSKGWVVR